jgi:hypothetical protein
VTRTQAVLLATVEQCEDELRRSWGGFAYADVAGKGTFRSIREVRFLLNVHGAAIECLGLLVRGPYPRKATGERTR